jgi:hypothetical protein
MLEMTLLTLAVLRFQFFGINGSFGEMAT